LCLYIYLYTSGSGSSVGIATGYELDGPGIESRWEARFSAPVQTGPGAYPASCTMRTGTFTGVNSGRGMMLTLHPLLVPWSRKGRAIPLLPLWAVRPVQSLSACTRVTFTFYLFTSTQRKYVKYCEATYCIPGGEYQNSEEHSASIFSIRDTGRQQLLSRRLYLSNCMVAHPRTQ